jgi:uncharacterized membrane protein
MTSPACLSALLLVAGGVAIAAPRHRLRPGVWSARAKARMLRAAMAVVAGSFAVALALSLVGVNAEASDQSPALRIGILASIAVAAVLIWRSRASGAEPL